MVAAFGHEGDRLSAFLDDELGERDALSVTRHLERCDECRDELEQLRTTRAALRALPPASPSLSWMVETAMLGPGEQTSSTAPTVALAVAVAAAVVMAAGFVLGGGQGGSVRPPVDALVVDHVRSVEGGPVVTPVRLDADPAGGG